MEFRTEYWVSAFKDSRNTVKWGPYEKIEQANQSRIQLSDRRVERLYRTDRGWLVELCSRPDETVLDPFAGSGTTLIACEQLGRRCRAIEIEPRYVAVALQRWADLTGGVPKQLA